MFLIGRSPSLWCLWLLCALALTLWLSLELFAREQKPHFLVGETSHAHHQIELACGACHREPFGGRAVLQEACVDCHGEQLRVEQDSHPRSKFTDPRNADTLAQLDARFCVACHREHDPASTTTLAVTLPRDFCFHCHQDIAAERPSHQGMGFETCANAGCHNFHDNRALYEDFLVANAGGDWLRTDARLASLATRVHDGFTPPAAARALPPGLAVPDGLKQDFAGSAHASAGMDCASCHGAAADWQPSPGVETCGACHEAQQGSFLQGRHGMRLAQGLPPMTPARSPASHPSLAFAEASRERELACSSCHDAHAPDTGLAAVDACLGCHVDEHSLAFEASPHGGLWRRFQAGELERAATVSCATCHLPRVEDGAALVVTHNQNDTLRPNEKMIRPVCLHCHNLAFSLDALADTALILRNFSGRPAQQVDSIDMALRRQRPGSATPSPTQGENR